MDLRKGPFRAFHNRNFRLAAAIGLGASFLVFLWRKRLAPHLEASGG